MRVAYLTAGAGGMYCGSCLRDNTLAAALRRQGREVLLVPLYSPIRTDEEDVSERRVLFGGLNVYLQQASAPARWFSRLFGPLLDAPGLLRFLLRFGESAPPGVLGPMTVAVLEGRHGPLQREVAKLIDGLAPLRPDVLHLPNAFFVGLAGPLREALRTPIVCTLSGEDIFLDKLPSADRQRVLDLIREQVDEVEAFICVSEHYRGYAARTFRISPGKLRHVPLGIRIERAITQAQPPESPLVIGYLARICHDKGLHLAAEALHHLRQDGRDCVLRAAGYLGRGDRRYLAQVRRDLSSRGLAERFEYVGSPDREGKARFLRSLHVFSVPTVYQEAKGIYVLEALAHGVPVVQPRLGSFPELIEATGGGRLCAPHDAADLARQIAVLQDDPEQRLRLGTVGAARVREAFSDEVMARRAWDVFESVAGPR